MSRPITIPARQGAAAVLKSGQHIKIINTHGMQVVDTWAFNVHDPLEHLSMQHLRATLNKGVPTAGDALISNHRRPMLQMLEDTSNGAHDTFIAACDIYRYILLGVKEYHENCQDNMFAALRRIGITDVQFCPSPLNLWMNTPIVENKLHWLPPTTKPGDYVVLEAVIDCAVVMSACPQDILPINGVDCTPMDVQYQVYDFK
ncbi:MAG: urea carboxylase-associated family protein [Desulfovibrio sp.]|jgi:uncharacterized protein YcgI (DUF1989 family)|nr:urea carboxylase-associated family protein [Desulfovibrio sp.]